MRLNFKIFYVFVVVMDNITFVFCNVHQNALERKKKKKMNPLLITTCSLKISRKQEIELRFQSNLLRCLLSHIKNYDSNKSNYLNSMERNSNSTEPTTTTKKKIINVLFCFLDIFFSRNKLGLILLSFLLLAIILIILQTSH